MQCRRNKSIQIRFRAVSLSVSLLKVGRDLSVFIVYQTGCHTQNTDLLFALLRKTKAVRDGLMASCYVQLLRGTLTLSKYFAPRLSIRTLYCALLFFRQMLEVSQNFLKAHFLLHNGNYHLCAIKMNGKEDDFCHLLRNKEIGSSSNVIQELKRMLVCPPYCCK